MTIPDLINGIYEGSGSAAIWLNSEGLFAIGQFVAETAKAGDARSKVMITRFRTETGSVYALDFDAMRWKRESKTDEGGCIRKLDGEESGPMIAATAVTIGRSVIIYAPPYPGTSEDTKGRSIITSAVVEVLS